MNNSHKRLRLDQSTESITTGQKGIHLSHQIDLPLNNGWKIVFLWENGFTCRGGNCQNVFAFLINRGLVKQLLYSCSQGSKFLPFGAHPFSESKQEFTAVAFLTKAAKTYRRFNHQNNIIPNQPALQII